jgi:hypothetical protein
LVESAQLRLSTGGNAMPETLPRPLVILTVIVALIAIFVGVKDYLDKRKSPNAQDSSTPHVVAYSSVATDAKKTPAKAKRGRGSEAANSARVLAAEEDMGKPMVSGEFGSGRTGFGYGLGVSQADPNQAMLVAGTMGEEKAARVLGAASSSACLPLPNGTNVGDVDAPYYQNWSRVYCEP